ncbi:MAG: protein kinase [Alphaproteobacteria bacterium]|nr:protein kinase [Alphaproteobacteria bacterium]
MPTVPDTIGPYEVIRPIAQGGMAEVFEVRDPESGERRALKLLMELKTSVKRFNREFEAMTRLNHPNIVRVYRYGFEGQHPWMSMEMLRGVPLQVRVKNFGAPGSTVRTDEVVRIAWFVANALQYIHDRGLVHRDLKSANVQVLRDGRVKLLDFGTAHLVDPLEHITQEGDFVGTFSYAAPEQIVGAPIDHRADLYALGILLYRLLSGRRPFKASDPHKVAHMHLHVDPPPLRDAVPELPDALIDLVGSLLQKQRKDRPQRADEVAAALERIAGGALSLRGLQLALYDDQALGRANELRRTWKALEESAPGHLVVVSAADLSDRTHLIDHVVADAEKRGILVARPSALDPTAPAVAQCLAALVDPRDEPSMALADVLGDPAGAAAATRVESLRAALPDLLDHLRSREQPAVVAVDALELREGAVSALLGELLTAARDTGTRLHVLVSVARQGTPAVVALQRVAHATTELALGALDARSTALAVGNLLHRRPPSREAARRIQRDTGGHPALLTEVVRSFVEEGILQVPEDGNRVDWNPGTQADQLPEPVRLRLDRDHGDLPVTWRRLLEVVEVVGGRASLAELAAGTALRPADLPVILDGMVEAGLVTWTRRPADPVLPVDPLFLRYVGSSMHPARRAAIQHLAADLVEREPASVGQVRVLVAVGRDELALERGREVARELLDHGEAVEALELLQAILPSADLPSTPVDQRLDVHLMFAEAMQRVRPLDARAVKALDAADRLSGTSPRGAEVRFWQAEQQRAIGHYANHRKFLVEVWDMIGQGERTPLRARAALELAESFIYGAQIPQARTWYDNALDAAMAVDDRDVADRARVGLAELMIAEGDVTGAEQILERLLTARGTQGDPLVAWHGIAAWAHALRRQGRFSELLPRLSGAIAEAREGQSIPARAAVTLAAAAAELDLYRLGRAQELVEELASALGPGERLHLRLETRLFQGRLAIASGQAATASFQLGEVVDQAEKAGLALLAELGRAYLAEARWDVGAHDEAKQLYQKALMGLMSTGNLTAVADAIVSRARVVGATDDPTKAFRLVRRLLSKGEMQPLYIEHLLAEVRWYLHQGDDTLVRQALREAQASVNRIAARQSQIEQAALRVHPWAHEVILTQQTLDKRTPAE